MKTCRMSEFGADWVVFDLLLMFVCTRYPEDTVDVISISAIYVIGAGGGKRDVRGVEYQ